MAFYYPLRDREQLALSARDLISETFPPYINAVGQAPATQTVHYGLLGLRAGDVVTNIVVSVNTAAVGTDPTSIYAGLYTAAGARVALTANLAASTTWDTQGQKELALTAAYTVPADGGYYCAFLIDGVFGTTNVALHRAGSNAVMSGAVPGGVAPHGAQAAQTSLPASATLATSANALWFGVN